MKQKKALILVAGILFLIGVSAVFYFKDSIFRSNYTDTKAPVSVQVDADNVLCPIETSQCRFASVFEYTYDGLTISQIGYYNVASISSILAVFDGELDYLDTNRLNEKKVTIKNGNLMAVYRFVGQLPTKLEKGQVKKGTVVGTLDQRISHFDNKYNFIFGIVDLDKTVSKKIQFNEGNQTFRILD